MSEPARALALTEENAETQARWTALLQQIAKGEKLEDAMAQCGVTRREMESVALSSPLESQRWRDARLLGKAARWTLLERDEIFERLGAGTEIERAITEVRGGENVERDVAELFELVAALPEWQERYDAAMSAKHLRDSQQILRIADDASRDTLSGPKGGEIPNMAAVGRSKVMIEARQWLWGKVDPKRFGEQKASTNVQVNLNYAEILENAQQRAKVRDKGVAPAKMREAIDAVFSEKPVPNRAEDAEQPATEQAGESQFSCLED